jgi:hypothetical protein
MSTLRISVMVFKKHVFTFVRMERICYSADKILLQEL